MDAKSAHIDLHVLVQAVAQDQVVRHAQAVRLHGVVGPVVHLPEIACAGSSHNVVI